MVQDSIEKSYMVHGEQGESAVGLLPVFALLRKQRGEKGIDRGGSRLERLSEREIKQEAETREQQTKQSYLLEQEWRG